MTSAQPRQQLSSPRPHPDLTPPLCSTSDNVQAFSSVLAVLVDHSFQPTVAAQDREAARAGLETTLDTLVTLLENNQVQYLVVVIVSNTWCTPGRGPAGGRHPGPEAAAVPGVPRGEAVL